MSSHLLLNNKPDGDIRRNPGGYSNVIIFEVSYKTLSAFVSKFTLRALAVSPGDFADLLVAWGDFLSPLADTCGDLKLLALPARVVAAREFPGGLFSWHLRALVWAGDFFVLLPGDFRVELRSLFSLLCRKLSLLLGVFSIVNVIGCFCPAWE